MANFAHWAFKVDPVQLKWFWFWRQTSFKSWIWSSALIYSSLWNSPPLNQGRFTGARLRRSIFGWCAFEKEGPKDSHHPHLVSRTGNYCTWASLVTGGFGRRIAARTGEEGGGGRRARGGTQEGDGERVREREGGGKEGGGGGERRRGRRCGRDRKEGGGERGGALGWARWWSAC